MECGLFSLLGTHQAFWRACCRHIHDKRVISLSFLPKKRARYQYFPTEKYKDHNCNILLNGNLKYHDNICFAATLDNNPVFFTGYSMCCASAGVWSSALQLCSGNDILCSYSQLWRHFCRRPTDTCKAHSFWRLVILLYRQFFSYLNQS